MLLGCGRSTINPFGGVCRRGEVGGEIAKTFVAKLDGKHVESSGVRGPK